MCPEQTNKCLVSHDYKTNFANSQIHFVASEALYLVEKLLEQHCACE